jgi:hypothetical protein
LRRQNLRRSVPRLAARLERSRRFDEERLAPNLNYGADQNFRFAVDRSSVDRRSVAALQIAQKPTVVPKFDRRVKPTASVVVQDDGVFERSANRRRSIFAQKEGDRRRAVAKTDQFEILSRIFQRAARFPSKRAVLLPRSFLKSR